MTTDAIFFLKDGKVIKEMMMSEFDAILDGIVEIPELKGRKIAAVYVQINDVLKIKGLVFFILPFNKEGQVVEEWNVPLNQLLQSSGRGPDLGAGAIRLVTRKQCTVPWHQDSLWDPQPQLFKVLASAVKANRLGILVDDDAIYNESQLDNVPTVAPSAPPVVQPVVTAEPPLIAPVVQPKAVPTAQPIPTAQPAAPVQESAPEPSPQPVVPQASPKPDAPEQVPPSVLDEPVTGGLDSECLEMPEDFGLGAPSEPASASAASAAAPVETEVLEMPEDFLQAPAAVTAPATPPAAPAPATADTSEQYRLVKMELDATKAAFKVKMDALKKERDEWKEKSQSISATLKSQAKDQIQNITTEFEHDLSRKDEQIEALKNQLEIEQSRYVELKEQHVEQASQYEADREDMMEKLQHNLDLSADKVESLKEAFKNEVNARIDAETAKINEKLAIREVELFYREEQMKIVQDEVEKLRLEKQNLLKDSGDNILESLDDNGVTFVTFQSGVGHITIHPDDIGRFLDQRLEYLADRCGVTQEEFVQWQNHYRMPTCQHVDADGQLCGKQVEQVELAAEFEDGKSNRCTDHQLS